MEIIDYLKRMGHAPFNYPTPEGYPDQASPWMGTLLWRWNFAVALSQNSKSKARARTWTRCAARRRRRAAHGAPFGPQTQPSRSAGLCGFGRRTGADAGFTRLSMLLTCLPSNISFTATATGKQALVVIFLRGGADGLNMVAPLEDDGYYRARPRIAITKAKALALDGFYGLNPLLSHLQTAYKDGALGIVHAAGSEDDTRSHFEAQDLMEHGGVAGGGWLGRFLARSHRRDQRAALRCRLGQGSSRMPPRRSRRHRFCVSGRLLAGRKSCAVNDLAGPPLPGSTR
jgi:hypothetical protein